jgi:hypothetical protein
VSGQLYADAVADSATAAAVAQLESNAVAIARVIDEATSYEDLRERLRALDPELSADDLGELVYRAMALGELAGRRAVTEDS